MTPITIITTFILSYTFGLGLFSLYSMIGLNVLWFIPIILYYKSIYDVITHSYGGEDNEIYEFEEEK